MQSQDGSQGEKEMRKLSAKQKKYLRTFGRNASYTKLKEMNDYETLWQDSQRFVMDLETEGKMETNTRSAFGGVF